MPHPHPLAEEIRRFILSYGEHDPDCPGEDANAWGDQLKVCTCGFAPRADELMLKLDQKLCPPGPLPGA